MVPHLRARALATLLAGVVLALGLPAGSALADGPATVVVELGADAPPSPVALRSGDAVVFASTEEPPVGADALAAQHRVVADVPGGLDVVLGPGERSAARTLTAAGTYAFTDERSVGPARGARTGSLVVSAPPAAEPPAPAPGAAPAPAPAPAAPAPAAPAPPAPAAPAVVPPTGAPSVGGQGYARAPSLALGALLPESLTPAGPAPLVAPEPPPDPAVLLAGGRSGLSALAPAAASADRLPQPPTPRRYGLPVALAVLGLLGVGSLLARTLLAEPADR